MRVIFWVLCLVSCLALCCGGASAQEHLSNFDTCIAESRQRHTDSTMPDYWSYKCDGATAQKLAARPDECSADTLPRSDRIEHKSRQLRDGLYLRMIWRTGVCAGMCETRFYSDSRGPSYLCEVRRHMSDRVARSSAQSSRYTTGRRYPNGYPPRRWAWRPRRTYEPPAAYWRRMQETEEDAPRIYDEPDSNPRYYRDYGDRDYGYRDDRYRDDSYRDYP
jgi:hypothetical protein